MADPEETIIWNGEFALPPGDYTGYPVRPPQIGRYWNAG